MRNKEIVDSIVVPIGEESFSTVIKRKIYFFPRPKKMNKEIKYIFFYRIKPIQAITHYGIIEKQIENADEMINLIDKMKIFRDPSKKASAYEFSKIEELKIKIPLDNTGPSIRGRIKSEFNKIIKLKSTRGLFKNDSDK